MFVLSFDNDLVMEMSPAMVRELANASDVFDERVRLMMRENQSEAAVVSQVVKNGRIHIVGSYHRTHLAPLVEVMNVCIESTPRTNVYAQMMPPDVKTQMKRDYEIAMSKHKEHCLRHDE